MDRERMDHIQYMLNIPESKSYKSHQKFMGCNR